MKTVKIILLSAIVALSVYSCASDREEDVNISSPNTVKLDLKKEKTNNKLKSASKIGDSIKANSQDGPKIPKGSAGSEDPNNDTGESPIVDPTKPDKPW